MTFIIIFVVVGVLTATAATAGTVYWLKRQNRVVRGIASPTPVGWLVSGRREARLHRRLRGIGRRLELVPATNGVADVIARLRIEIIELDGYLVTVANRPTATRRTDRSVVEERVKKVEALVRRIEERGRTEPVSLTELSERLDALDAADDELRRLGPS